MSWGYRPADGQRRIHLLITTAFVLSACGGGSGPEQTPPPASIERINGIAVPPAPDTNTNQATVAGVDSNANDIRDDIDRLLATNFGTEPQLLTLATEHARRLQAVIVSRTSTANEAYVSHVRCVRDRQVLDRLSSQSRAILDTTARRKTYGLAMAGVAVSLEGC